MTFTMAGFSATTSFAGLSLRSPLNAACRILPPLGKAGEFDFGDQLRLQPVNVAGLARRVLAAERTFLGLGLLQRRHDAPDRVLARNRFR